MEIMRASTGFSQQKKEVLNTQGPTIVTASSRRDETSEDFGMLTKKTDDSGNSWLVTTSRNGSILRNGKAPALLKL